MDRGPGHEVHSQAPGRRAKASLILFVITIAILLADIIGPVLLSSGSDIIGSRLHDQLAVLAALSVLVMLILLAIGAVLGTLEWHAVRRASGRPRRLAILAACLNLALLLIGVLVIGYFICMFQPPG